ncbi:hypothetical protein D9M71_684960 [compost metagenome]
MGGVPISVVMPPRIEAKDSGISTLPGASRCFAAICRAIGINSARAPTLFMKLDSTAASTSSASRLALGPTPPGSRRCARMSTAPLVCRP